MGYTFQESDWKQFRSRIGGWQENYMRKLITGYIVMLSDDTKSPSEKFWALEEKINDDKKLYGVTCERSIMANTMMHSMFCSIQVFVSQNSAVLPSTTYISMRCISMLIISLCVQAVWNISLLLPKQMPVPVEFR